MIRTCSLCTRELDPNDRSTYRRVQGWERKALSSSSRRGGSDLYLREPTGEFACSPCVERLRSGLAPSQGALL